MIKFLLYIKKRKTQKVVWLHWRIVDAIYQKTNAGNKRPRTDVSRDLRYVIRRENFLDNDYFSLRVAETDIGILLWKREIQRDFLTFRDEWLILSKHVLCQRSCKCPPRFILSIGAMGTFCDYLVSKNYEILHVYRYIFNVKNFYISIKCKKKPLESHMNTMEDVKRNHWKTNAGNKRPKDKTL